MQVVEPRRHGGVERDFEDRLLVGRFRQQGLLRGDGEEEFRGLAEVVASRDGIGGVVGQKRTYFSWRFVVDFAGGNLPLIGKNVKVEPVINASRGTIEIASARPLQSTGGYRAMFDLKPVDADSTPVDLRLYLRADGQPLTETWFYQWSPPEDRRLA